MSLSALEMVLVPCGFFVALVLVLETGRFLGRRRRERDPQVTKGIGAVEGSVYGLLGLLLALSFSGATQRFDARRQLILQEANAIGTAYLRLDLLPEEDRTALQQSFRDYLDSRLEVYRKLPNLRAAFAALDRSNQLQAVIWSRAVSASQKAGSPAPTLLLPALNAMFDITTTRTAATRMHPPTAIFALLGILALGGALLIGFSMSESGRSWMHTLIFAVFMTLTLYTIIDLEFPRIGLIRVDDFDQVLVDLRRSFEPAR
jgi:hypothetical protein